MIKVPNHNDMTRDELEEIIKAGNGVIVGGRSAHNLDELDFALKAKNVKPKVEPIADAKTVPQIEADVRARANTLLAQKDSEIADLQRHIATQSDTDGEKKRMFEQVIDLQKQLDAAHFRADKAETVLTEATTRADEAESKLEAALTEIEALKASATAMSTIVYETPATGDQPKAGDAPPSDQPPAIPASAQTAPPKATK